MAITIVKSPKDTHTPAYNDQYFVVSGTNTSQPNFRYVCNVLVGGVLSQEKYAPRPDNSFAYINPQRFVEAAVLNLFNSSVYQIERNEASYKKVIVGIEEEYGSTPAIYPGVSGTYYAWNGAYPAYDFSQFVYSTNQYPKFLSTIDKFHIYSDMKYCFMSWHRGFSSRDFLYMVVTAFNSAGATIQQTLILNNFWNFAAALDRNGLLYFNCSPYGFARLESLQPGDIFSKSNALLPIIPTTAVTYTIHTTYNNTDPDVGMPDATVYIDNFCSKYQKCALHFLNQLGNYDPFVFNLVRRHPNTKKTSEYKKIPYELNSSNKYTYSNEKSDRMNYNTVVTRKLTLNSDWINDDEAEWLLDLFMSPDIKYEDETGNLFSVENIDKAYEIKYKKNDKLTNITINLEFSYEDIRQRG